MQSFLHIQSHSFPLQFPCKSIFPSNFSPQNPNFTTPHNLSLNSLKSSIDSRTQQLIEDEDKFRPRERLPIAIKKNGKVGRYFWSGNSMEIVQLDCGGQGFELGFEIGVRKLMGDCGLAVKNLFIPKQVRVNYIEYVKWKLLHRVFSSALQVLATQAMFRAIGVGYAQSLPSAAALNWVLKDGLGRLSRCIYTASVGSAFDTNLKRVRFATSILFSLSIGVELMTPAFPHCFLLLASLANIAKQISSACYLATGTAVHRSFAIADNLGEVSAKAQIQTVCFDNIGLLLAAALNMICRNNQRLQAGLPFVVYPIFSAIDLFGIYQALKHVHLQTLTKVRLEIILDTWIQFGYVLSPAQVSEEEGINLLDNTGKRVWPIRIGCLNLEKQLSELTLLTMESLSDEDYYFICMETCGEVKTGRIVVSLREGAGTADTITGLLQACYVRRVLISDPSHWEKIEDLSGISDSLRLEWLKLIEKSKHRAKGEMKQLNDQMMKLGWSGKNILLSTQEQARYSFVNDNV